MNWPTNIATELAKLKEERNQLIEKLFNVNNKINKIEEK